MRSRFRRPSPALIVAMVALFVALGGGAYAATKIGTKQLQNGAVTKLKIRNGAVDNNKLAPAARGRAVAYAQVNSDGTVGARTRGISAANITKPGGAAGAIYCFRGLPSHGGVAVTPEFLSDEFGSFAIASLDQPPFGEVNCPGNTQFAVVTQFFNIVADTAPFTAEPFSVVLFK